MGHIFCGHLGIDEQAWWSDRCGIEQLTAEIEAASVALLICGRKGLSVCSNNFEDIISNVKDEMPTLSLNGVFHATQYIEEKGRAVWKKPKKKSRYQSQQD